MIQTREELRFYIAEDGKHNGFNDGYLHYLIRLLIRNENALAFHYLRILRHCEYHYNKRSFVHKFIYYYYYLLKIYLGSKYQLQIPLNRTGYGLRIIHLSGGGGVLLNINKVGNYCAFNSGVILGDNGKDAVPTLGDRVTFAPGAKAFGKIVIGNNVFVAPNAVVTKNFPDNCIIGGIPAKILKYKEE